MIVILTVTENKVQCVSKRDKIVYWNSQFRSHQWWKTKDMWANDVGSFGNFIPFNIGLYTIQKINSSRTISKTHDLWISLKNVPTGPSIFVILDSLIQMVISLSGTNFDDILLTSGELGFSIRWNWIFGPLDQYLFSKLNF